MKKVNQRVDGESLANEKGQLERESLANEKDQLESRQRKRGGVQQVKYSHFNKKGMHFLYMRKPERHETFKAEQ